MTNCKNKICIFLVCTYYTCCQLFVCIFWWFHMLGMCGKNVVEIQAYIDCFPIETKIDACFDSTVPLKHNSDYPSQILQFGITTMRTQYSINICELLDTATWKMCVFEIADRDSSQGWWTYTSRTARVAPGPQSWEKSPGTILTTTHIQIFFTTVHYKNDIT